MLSIAEVLRMPAVRSAEPEVLAGAAQLDRPVHWVHTTELADIGPLLRGGDLVLTTGIALPDHDATLAEFARSLSDSGAAGLFVELGRRWTAVPGALTARCEELGLPLVALRREVRFAAVAQAVGERLVDDQVAELRAAQRVHETFTELSITEAGPDEILAAAQRLSGAAVVLESEQHQILDFRAGPEDATVFLDDWARRSRNVGSGERTVWDPSNGWLVTRVGRAERGWGRLVIGAASAPSQRLIAVAERAAAALAMHRLHDRSRDSQVRRVHHELLLGLLTQPGDGDLHRRVEVAGLPREGRQYVGLALRPAGGPGSSGPGSSGPGSSGPVGHVDDLVATCLSAAARLRMPVLVSAFGTEVRVLAALPVRADPGRPIERWAEVVGRRAPTVVAAGSPVSELQASARTLLEASHVLGALPVATTGASVHRLEDVHVRGLLALLADDERVRAFVDRELEPLRHQPELARTALVVIEHWGNKVAAAEALNLSRPVLYDRIAKLERLLGRSLADAEVRTSLHLALLGDLVHPAPVG